LSEFHLVGISAAGVFVVVKTPSGICYTLLEMAFVPVATFVSDGSLLGAQMAAMVLAEDASHWELLTPHQREILFASEQHLSLIPKQHAVRDWRAASVTVYSPRATGSQECHHQNQIPIPILKVPTRMQMRIHRCVREIGKHQHQ
jgi:hypothetical protein